MAIINFYKKDGSYYTADTNTKIKDLAALQTFAKASGKEVTPQASVGTFKPAQPSVGTYKPVGQSQVPTQMTATDIAQPPVATVPTPVSQKPEALASSLAEMAKIQQEEFKRQDEAMKAREAKLDTNMSAINEALAQYGQKGTRYAEETSKMGVADQVKQLSETTMQRATAQAKYTQLAEQVKNQPLSSRIIGGTQDRLLRQSAIEAGSLATIEQAIQGNIDFARQTAKEVVDLEFEPLQTVIEQQKAQLELNYDLFTGAEKRRADARIASVNAQLADIAEKKAEKEAVYNTMTVAAQYGASTDVLEAIKKASSKEIAAIIAANGATYISSPTQLAGLKEADLIRDGKNVYKKGKTNYLAQPASQSDYKLEKIGDNAYGIFNPETGSLEPVGNFGGQPGVMRTDRNNNPTAMTTDVAKSLGLVEGIDYVQGDAFPDNPKLFTAKLIGDPVVTTIKALDSAANDNRMQAFYTQGGRQRWDYIGMTDTEWLKLSEAEKAQVIAGMYSREGGSGELLGATPAKTLSPLAKAVQSGTIELDKLSQEERGKVAAELAETGTKTFAQTEKAKVDARKAITTNAALQSNLELVNKIKNSGGLNSAVGPAGIFRVPLWDVFGNKADFLNDAARLLSSQALNALIEAKQGGATFGALSDRELDILSSASTSLGNMAKRDKNGRIVGFIGTEESFKAELDRLAESYSKLLELNPNGIQPASTTPGGVTYTEEKPNATPGGRTYTIIQ